MNKEVYYKFYDLETLTQDDLNNLALERNTFVKEIEKLNNIIDELEDYLSRFLYMLNGITDRDIYEQCQLDDFTQVLDKLKELKGE